ncbi:MAG: DUF1217 domain-containing protein [Acetobacteraceae bacterium]|nr:DUF1217 domain-containing protein [Acetobacteraceae bacterium]
MQQAERDQTKDVAAEANDPSVKRDIDAFKTALSKAKDLPSLLADPTARKVLLTANGLGDQTDYTALATKALMSDPSDTKSLANQLSDQRWLTMAKTYNFAQNGLSTLKDPTVLSTLTNGYAEVMWRQSLDQTTPGLSNALDFRSRASTITSALQILGDSNLRSVVTTALGIPEQIAFQSLDAQEKAITDRVDISKFKDPTFVEQFTRRYLVAAGEATNSSSQTSQSSGLLV